MVTVGTVAVVVVVEGVVVNDAAGFQIVNLQTLLPLKEQMHLDVRCILLKIFYQ